MCVLGVICKTGKVAQKRQDIKNSCAYTHIVPMQMCILYNTHVKTRAPLMISLYELKTLFYYGRADKNQAIITWEDQLNKWCHNKNIS